MSNFGKCLGFFDRQGFDATTSTFSNWANAAYNTVLGGVVIRGNASGSGGVDGMTWAQLQPTAGTPAGSGALAAAGTTYIDAMFNQADAYNATLGGGGGGGGGIPTPDHVVIVWLENKNYGDITTGTGNNAAPYIMGTLKPNSAWFTDSHGVTHPSEPNYLAFWSGSQQGVTGDFTGWGATCPSQPANTPGAPFSAASLGSQLASVGKTYAGYFETMPSDGWHTCNSGNYAVKHNPICLFTSDYTASTNKTFNSWPLVVNPSNPNWASLPTVSFVVPNLVDDMHSGTILAGDNWLKAHIEPYRQWLLTSAGANSLLIISFDEGDGSTAGSTPNQIVTLFSGQPVNNGTYSETITHYNVLRTIEAMYGLPGLGNAASATKITDCWAGTTGPPPSNPWTLKLRVFAGENAPAWAQPTGGAPSLLLQPFAPTSIWNTPLGTGATYSPSAVLPPPSVPMRADESPVLMDKTQPTVPYVHNNNGFHPPPGQDRCSSTTTFSVNVPCNPNFLISCSATHNYESSLLDSGGSLVYNGTAFAHGASSGPITTTAQAAYSESLSGAGLGPSGAVVGGKGGKGGSGLSTLGGIIRKGELLGSTPIKHALAINIDLNDNASPTSDGLGGTAGNGYIWPAIKKDGYTYVGSSGYICPGSLLALKQSFNINASLTTAPARKIAYALQNFGGYVGNDTKDSAFSFCTEISPDINTGVATSVDVDEWNANFPGIGAFDTGASSSSAWAQDCLTIIANLFAVTNNTPSTIGGPGNRVVTPAGTSLGTTAWWDSTYEASWERFMGVLAAYVPKYTIRSAGSSGGLAAGPNTQKLDGHPLLGAVVEQACMTAGTEPLLKIDYDQGNGLTAALAAGMTDNAEFNQGAMSGTQISAMASMKTNFPKTVWDVAFDPMVTIQAGGSSEAKTEALIDYQIGAELQPNKTPNSGSLFPLAEMGNDSLRANGVVTPVTYSWATSTGTYSDPQGANYTLMYTKIAGYGPGKARVDLSLPISVQPQPMYFQTSSYVAMGNTPTSLLNTINYAIWLGARMIELPSGYTALTTTQLNAFISQLLANDPPLVSVIKHPAAVSALTAGLPEVLPRRGSPRLRVAPFVAPPPPPPGPDSTWAIERRRG